MVTISIPDDNVDFFYAVVVRDGIEKIHVSSTQSVASRGASKATVSSNSTDDFHDGKRRAVEASPSFLSFKSNSVGDKQRTAVQVHHETNSVDARERHLHWSMHQGPEHDCRPVIAWKTPWLKSSDIVNHNNEGEDLEVEIDQEENICQTENGEKQKDPQLQCDPTCSAKDVSSPLAALHKHLVPSALEYVWTNLQENRKIHIYIVCPNHLLQQEGLIRKMWKYAAPFSEVVLLKTEHFLWNTTDTSHSHDASSATHLHTSTAAATHGASAKKHHSGLSSDQLAGLRGAGYQYGYPSLVMDVGPNSMSYVCADASGAIVGGGVGPGIHIKLRAFLEHHYRQNDNGHSDSDGPTTMSTFWPPFVVEGIIQRMLEDAEAPSFLPLKTFSFNETDCILADVLGEISSKCRRIISSWLGLVETSAGLSSISSDNGTIDRRTKRRRTERTNFGYYSADVSTSSSVTQPDEKHERQRAQHQRPSDPQQPCFENKERKVVVTGSDGRIVAQLLRTDSTLLEQPKPSLDYPGVKPFHLVLSHCLIHYGVGATIARFCRDRVHLQRRHQTADQSQHSVEGKMPSPLHNKLHTMPQGKSSGKENREDDVGELRSGLILEPQQQPQFYNQQNGEELNQTVHPQASVPNPHRSESPQNESNVVGNNDCKYRVGTLVAKKFYAAGSHGKDRKEEIFVGKVTEAVTAVSSDGKVSDWFFVVYEDGDSEHVRKKDLREMIRLHKKVAEMRDK